MVNFNFASDAVHDIFFKSTTDEFGEKGREVVDYANQKLNESLDDKLKKLQSLSDNFVSQVDTLATNQRIAFIDDLSRTATGSIDELDSNLQDKLDKADKLADQTMQQGMVGLNSQQAKLLKTLQNASIFLAVLVILVSGAWYALASRAGDSRDAIKHASWFVSVGLLICLVFYGGSSFFYHRSFDDVMAKQIANFVKADRTKDVEGMELAARFYAVLDPGSDKSQFLTLKARAYRQLAYFSSRKGALDRASDTLADFNAANAKAPAYCDQPFVRASSGKDCFDIGMAVASLYVLERQSNDRSTDYFVASAAYNLLSDKTLAAKLTDAERGELLQYILNITVSPPDADKWHKVNDEASLKAEFADYKCTEIEKNPYARCFAGDSHFPFGFTDLDTLINFAGAYDMKTLPDGVVDRVRAQEKKLSIRTGIESAYGTLLALLAQIEASSLSPQAPSGQALTAPIFTIGVPELKPGLWQDYLDAVREEAGVGAPRPDPVLLAVVADLRSALPYSQNTANDLCGATGLPSEWVAAAMPDDSPTRTAAMTSALAADCASALAELKAMRRDLMAVFLSKADEVAPGYIFVPPVAAPTPPSDTFGLFACKPGACEAESIFRQKVISHTVFSGPIRDPVAAKRVVARATRLGLLGAAVPLDTLARFYGTTAANPFGTPGQPTPFGAMAPSTPDFPTTGPLAADALAKVFKQLGIEIEEAADQGDILAYLAKRPI